jgi:hypothetical protein
MAALKAESFYTEKIYRLIFVLIKIIAGSASRAWLTY